MVYFSNINLLPHQLTELQHEVLIGGLLGDAHLSLGKGAKYPRLAITRQFGDLKYLEWQFNIFNNLCSSNIKIKSKYDKRDDSIREYCYFRTRNVPAFLEYHKKWYLNKIKIIPQDLNLTPLILAIWFADDGSVSTSGKRSISIQLHTESFGEEGSLFLSKKLENKFNSKFPIYKKYSKRSSNVHYIIKTGSQSSYLFLKEIQLYMNEIGMERKYNKWKNLNFNLTPKRGALYKNHRLIYDTIINLKNFSNNEIFDVIQIYNKSHLRQILDKFYNDKYLNIYQTNNFPRSYRYELTELGKIFFKNPPIDDMHFGEFK